MSQSHFSRSDLVHEVRVTETEDLIADLRMFRALSDSGKISNAQDDEYEEVVSELTRRGVNLYHV
jgi:hypothetical protein